MRKIIVHCDNSKALGCDSHEALLVEDTATDEEIDEIAFDMACEHASSYWSIVDDSDDINEDYETYDDYIFVEQIDASWEDYDAEKHDMLKAGGGSFADDFEQELCNIY